MLQMHFMTITGQNIDSPTRKLYPWELRYIHSRFGIAILHYLLHFFYIYNFIIRKSCLVV